MNRYIPLYREPAVGYIPETVVDVIIICDRLKDICEFVTSMHIIVLLACDVYPQLNSFLCMILIGYVCCGFALYNKGMK